MTRSALFVVALLWATSSTAQEVPTEAWITQMRSILPAHTCQEGQYFRECFSGTPQQCNETMSSLVDACVEQYKDQIPETIKMPDDGRRWGQVLGSCAGGQYDVARKSDRIDSPKCNNPRAWM